MNYKQLKQDLAKGKLAPVYLLYGDEGYLIEDTLRRLEQLVLKEGFRDFNYQCFYGEDAQAADIINAAKTLPIMAKYRLIVLKHVEQLKAQELKKLADYAAKPSDSAVLVLCGDNLESKKAWVKSFSAKCVAVRFYPLYDSDAIAWIQTKVREADYKIGHDATQSLLELSGNDLATLANQLEKLYAYTNAEKVISLAVVDLVVGRVRQHNIFELVEAIGNKEFEPALRILAKIMAQGEPPTLVLAMISRQLRRIFRAKCMLKQGESWDRIGHKVGVPKFFIKSFVAQTQHFSLSELQVALHDFLDTDIKFKSGTQSPRLRLEFLLLSLCC